MLFETMAQGVVYQDRAGKIISANPAAQRILGLSLEQMMGRTSIDPRWRAMREDGTDFPGELHPAMAALRTGQQVKGVVMGVFNPQEDAIRWILINAVPLFHDGEDTPYQVYTSFEDITRLRKVEKDLQEKTQMFEAIVEASPLAIDAVDLEGKALLWSPAAERMFGWTAEEVIGCELPFTTLPNGQEAKSQVEEQLDGKSFAGLETRRPRKDGSLLDISLSSAPMTNANGEIYGTMAIIVDISERKKNERQVRMLAKIPDESPNPIARISQDGDVLYANSACQPLLDDWGCQSGALLPEELRSVVTNILGNGEIQEMDIVCGVRAFTMLLVPVIDGGYVNVYGLDITTRKLAEQALQESEAKFRSIFENAPIGITLADVRTGKPLQVNQILLDMLGYSEEELVRLSFTRFSHPDDLAVEWPLFQELLEGKRESYQLEKRYIRKDQQIIWVSLNISLIQDQSHSPYVFGMVENITARKQAEDLLQAHMEENLQRTQELEAIVGISNAMRRVETQQEMIDVLLDHAISVLGAQAGGIDLINRNIFAFKSTARSQVEMKTTLLSKEQKLLQGVMQKGSPLVIHMEDEGEYARLYHPLSNLFAPVHSLVLMPLKSGAVSIGVLILGYQKPVQYDQRQAQMMTTIADMAGNALHRMSIADMLETLAADRTHELETIFRVTAAASKPIGLEAALESTLEMILVSMNAQLASMLLVTEERDHLFITAEKDLPDYVREEAERIRQQSQTAKWALAHKKPLMIPDLLDDPCVKADARMEVPYAVLPMRSGKKVVGALEIMRCEGNQFNVEELTLLSFIADHLGLVIENARLLQQAEQNAVLKERSRLARELHDSVTQSLYSATLFADGGRRLAEQEGHEQYRNCLVTLGEVVQQALKEMRLMVYELRSPGLQSGGLVQAIRQRLDAVENRAGIKASLEAGNIPSLPGWIEEMLYRIILEALNNALKHARAANIVVQLECKNNILRVSVNDDGVGFDVDAIRETGGMGLTTMQERAKRLNGDLCISSIPGSGTAMTATFSLIDLESKPAGKKRKQYD